MTDGMVWIEGSRFLMGSDSAYPEERPVREVEVGGFFIDPHKTGAHERVNVAGCCRFQGSCGLCGGRGPESTLND